LSILVFSDNPIVEETQLVLKELQSRLNGIGFLAPWDIKLSDLDNLNYELVYVPSNMLHRGSTFELIHRLQILKELEKKSIIVNSVDSMLYYNKGNLTFELEKNHVTHPKTIITENLQIAKEFANQLLEMDKDVVIKPLCRARGVGVNRLRCIWKRGQLTQFLVWYNRTFGQGVYYLQEFIPNYGYDIRCMVVGDTIVGREKRSNLHDFRYNISTGGLAEAYYDTQFDELALKVAKIVDLKIAGLDILLGIDGQAYVLEANAYPGYKALMEATGLKLFEDIVDYLLSLI
jgi:RimK family alpha-L-glutamate ligase